MTRERSRAELFACILSGIPSITILSFLQCLVFKQGLFLGAPSRRFKEIPLAREDIPDNILIAPVQHLRLARMLSPNVDV